MPPDPPQHDQPVPAVVARTREEMRRAERRRELRRWAPSLLVALLLHAAGAWWLWTLRAELLVEPLEVRLDASFADESLPAPPEHRERLELAEEPEPEMVEPEVLVEEELPETDDEPDFGQDVIGVGGGELGGSRRGGMARGGMGVEGAELSDAGLGDSPFRDFVEGLRRRGLDVVFVVDATASMGEFIALARAAIDDVIGDLAGVVPDLRIGIVAYRDHTDEWVVRRIDLGTDRYLIHNFLLDLTAVGGGDIEEAVDEGLRVAFDELAWRDGARHVVLLVGDAAVHPEDESAMLESVRAFARRGESLVNVLYTGAEPGREPTPRDAETRKAMDKIARSGNGLLLHLLTDDAVLRERITDATFGTEWKAEIARLLASAGEDRRARIARVHVERGHREWLLRQLAHEPVHPAVVQGCLELFDASLAREALALCLDESRPAPVRSVALYLLKRGVAADAALDVREPLAAQSDAVARLRRRVERFAAGGAQVVPPPPVSASPSGG